MTTESPAVSVIMATHNGAHTIRASIDSILVQTHRDLEIIVTDDCSTDDTRRVLDSIGDPRLRILRNAANLGVVASRNRCFAHARGRYVAMLDHDDLSAPTRIAHQVEYLNRTPGIVVVGTASRVLDGGVLRRMNHPAVTTPGLIAWLLLVANPIVCSSVMFRADAVRRLGVFMRDTYTYADDYDFYHRMSALGGIARLDSALTIYRLHQGNAFRRHENLMTDNAVRVLTPAYTRLFGAGSEAAARLVVLHLSAGKPVPNEAALDRLGQVFDTLNRSVLDDPATDAATASGLRRHADLLWRRMLQATSKTSGVGLAALIASQPAGVRLGTRELTRLLAHRLPLRARTRDIWRRVVPPARPMVVPSTSLFGTAYLPRLPSPEGPPVLFVVVDTEAEFDWARPFARDLTAVSAMEHVGRGQAVFDAYGLRPIYVVDYPVASQPEACAGVRAILERGGCEIGAHLHPWTTPPFAEPVSAYNSYPGNLDPALEAAKLGVLVAAVEKTFGAAPKFYKAGRYGFGPATPACLTGHGIAVDLSILPGADLRRDGGPDFRRLMPVPYHISGTSILSVPMTRFDVGMMPPAARFGHMVQQNRGGALLRFPSALSRLGLAETITLTPEGVTAGEQIRLLQAMLGRGYRQFVLHYHSPSLTPGHTPYVRDMADLDIFLGRLRAVCAFFFDDFGGLPGLPSDLLRVLQPLSPI